MWKRGLSLVVLIALISLVIASADFDLGDPEADFQLTYGPNETLVGWLNISFEGTDADIGITDSEDNVITLLDLLRTDANEDFEYNCSTASCEPEYSQTGLSSETLNFDLDAGDSVIVGFSLKGGSIEQIANAGFMLTSDASSSCTNQIDIDILANGIVDFVNNNAIDSSCYTKDYGCFDDDESLTEALIQTTPFCQRIKLTQSPSFLAGAWIKKESEGSTESIFLELREKDGDTISGAVCEIDRDAISEGEVYCEIDYSVTESDDYYVCLYRDGSGGKYWTRGYSDSDEGCGFSSWPSGQNEKAAYQIFAQGLKFDAVNTINVSNTLPSQESFSYLIDNYLDENYGYDCEDECVVPIEIKSNIAQHIEITNLSVEYRSDYFGVTREKELFEADEDVSEIDADMQLLYFNDANFILPDDYDDYDYKIYWNSEEVFEDKIYIEEVPQVNSVSPTTIAVNFPTTITANVENQSEILEYQWEFGDNETLTTTTNKAKHTYDEEGYYKLTVTTLDVSGLEYSKTFTITVSDAKDTINETIKKKMDKLEEINDELNSFTSFKKSAINNLVNISLLGNQLKDLKREFVDAEEDDYADIIEALLSINVPESIYTSKKADGSISFVSESNIDPEILDSISEGRYYEGQENAYVDAIYAWSYENIETTVDYEKVIISYEEGTQEIYIFKMNIENSNSIEPFFIMRTLENLKVDKNYLEENPYIYTTLSKGKNSISFSTTEEIVIPNIPYFISPDLNNIEINTITGDFGGDEEGSKWTLFVLIIIFLILGALGVYIFMQQWYKNKYENYLFQNKNNLYNLVNFVENSKDKGMTNEQIEAQLKRSKWSSEQIDYVMKKYAGKSTGVPEIIPIGKIMNKLKRNKNVQPKTGNFPQNNMRRFR